MDLKIIIMRKSFEIFEEINSKIDKKRGIDGLTDAVMGSIMLARKETLEDVARELSKLQEKAKWYEKEAYAFDSEEIQHNLNLGRYDGLIMAKTMIEDILIKLNEQ